MSDSLVQIIGIVAGILTSVALVPQVVKIYRERNSDQISLGFLTVLMSGQSLWIVYGVLKSDVPVIATNIFSVLISVTMMVMGIKYKK